MALALFDQDDSLRTAPRSARGACVLPIGRASDRAAPWLRNASVAV